MSAEQTHQLYKVYPESKLLLLRHYCVCDIFCCVDGWLSNWYILWFDATYFTWHSSRAESAKRTMSEKTGMTTHSLGFTLGGTELIVRSTSWSKTSELVVSEWVTVCFCHKSPQPSACRCMQSSCWLVDASLLHCKYNLHINGILKLHFDFINCSLYLKYRIF